MTTTTPRTLLVILAHPDDESFPMGGTLARYAAKGVRVTLVCATRGEAGIPGLSSETAGQVRDHELHAAAAALGLAEVRFLGYHYCEDCHLEFSSRATIKQKEAGLGSACDSKRFRMAHSISKSSFIPVLWLILALLGLTGCGVARAGSLPYVDLRQRESLPAAAPVEITPLHVAVASVISPRGTVESYQPLLDYLSRRLDRPVELIQRRTYAEVNDLIKAGEVDLAFVCTSAYVIGQRDFGMELLVAPQVNGEVTYQSVLIVPANSPVQDLASLRGQTFAFTDPWSASGRMYPTALVNALGETPETFFSRTFFTYSHDDAIRAVASGVADGAAVDSLVYEFALAREPRLGEQTQVIHRSPLFGIPPVVTSPQLRPQVRAELQSIFLEMNTDPAGRPALEALDFDRFVLIDDAAYNSIRELEAQVGPLVLE